MRYLILKGKLQQSSVFLKTKTNLILKEIFVIVCTRKTIICYFYCASREQLIGFLNKQFRPSSRIFFYPNKPQCRRMRQLDQIRIKSKDNNWQEYSLKRPSVRTSSQSSCSWVIGHRFNVPDLVVFGWGFWPNGAPTRILKWQKEHNIN